MAQTLCANLRCGYNSLEKLNKTFSNVSTIGCLRDTSNAVMVYYFDRFSPDIDIECSVVAGKIRHQFSKVINELTTSWPPETTVTDEWPVASEFNGWATDDCVEFCNSHGFIDDLRKCRDALDRIFSSIKRSSAELDYYQEIDADDEGHVVIRLEMDSDRETYRKEYKTWVNWIVEHLNDKSRMLISTSIDRS